MKPCECGHKVADHVDYFNGYSKGMGVCSVPECGCQTYEKNEETGGRLSAKLGDAYARYMTKVKNAQSLGFSVDEIIAELRREKTTIQPRAIMKAATLATDRNPYKKREAIRAAGECAAAIDKICKELAETVSVGQSQIKETHNG